MNSPGSAPSGIEGAKKVECAGCDTTMIILPKNAQLTTAQRIRVQWGTKCGGCERVYCQSCSNMAEVCGQNDQNDQTAGCGAYEWTEIRYL